MLQRLAGSMNRKNNSHLERKMSSNDSKACTSLSRGRSWPFGWLPSIRPIPSLVAAVPSDAGWATMGAARSGTRRGPADPPRDS